MSVNRLAVQLLAFVLIISQGTGCGLGITPTNTPPAAITPTATPEPTREDIQTFIQELPTITMETANQAELDMVNLQRDQSGARTAFGDQADAIFLQIDQDKASALDEMLNRVVGSVNNPLKVTARLVKPGASGTSRVSPLDKPSYLTRSMVQAFITILLTTQISSSRNENAIGDITEGGDPVGAPGTHYSFQPLLFGSRLEATGTITTIVTTPFPYQETIGFDLSMEVCPDAQGNVPIHLSLHSAASLLGGGVQLGTDSQVTGHVNDEGALDSTDFNSTYQGSRQPIHGVGDNLGTVNTFFERQENVTLYENQRLPPTGTEGYSRQSSEVDQQFNHDAIQEMRFINTFVLFQALDTAKKKWTTGYCVEISVPELGSSAKTVDSNSETQFTAHVRHKFEEVELQVPVIATLTDGQVSVNPSGSKVPAPAAFTYKAADQGGQIATVNLETRSKRGIAKLDLKFTTGVVTWTGEGTIRIGSDSSGLEATSDYTFSIKFHDLAPGTIEGDGVLTMIEQTMGSNAFQCVRRGVSSIQFPPMKVSGTIKPDGTLLLTLVSFSAPLPPKMYCTSPGGSYSFDAPASDGGIIIENISLPPTDGAQANGGLGGSAGTTDIGTWTLQIHKQTTP